MCLKSTADYNCYFLTDPIVVCNYFLQSLDVEQRHD